LPNEPLEFEVGNIGIVVPGSDFDLNGLLTDLGRGYYGMSFLAPLPQIGYDISVLDTATGYGDDYAFMVPPLVPEPNGTLMLLGASLFVIGLTCHRNARNHIRDSRLSSPHNWVWFPR
jgi:hypothetical protein